MRPLFCRCRSIDSFSSKNFANDFSRSQHLYLGLHIEQQMFVHEGMKIIHEYMNVTKEQWKIRNDNNVVKGMNEGIVWVYSLDRVFACNKSKSLNMCFIQTNKNSCTPRQTLTRFALGASLVIGGTVVSGITTTPSSS